MSRIVFLIILFLSFIPFFSEGERNDVYVITSGSILTILSCALLARYKEYPYSLYRMTSLFFLIFFSIAPMLQYKGDVRVFGGKHLPDNSFIMTNIVLIGVMLLYALFYSYFFKKRITKKWSAILIFFNVNNLAKRNVLDVFLLYFLSIVCFLIVFQSYDFNLLSLLIRDGEFISKIDAEKSSSLVIGNFIRPIPLFVFFFYSFLRKKTDIHSYIFFLIGLLTAFPLGLPRFAAASLYIPFLLIYTSFFRKKNIFPMTLILGLLVIFPFLNNFRYFSVYNKIGFKLDFNMFTEGHFDSYQSLLRIVYYDIITYGEQLLGVMFFWIPRSIWTSKPLGSGWLMSEKLGLDFGNISCNYFAEGYINFGFVGIFFFVVLFAYITANLDKLYWKHFVAFDTQGNTFYIWYFLLLGFVFFVLRGDLLSSFAYLIGFSLSFFTILFSVKFKRALLRKK